MCLMEKSALGEETQGDHAGGITTVTGVGTDAVSMVMESWGR